MEQIITNRRKFLRTTALTCGGLLVGFNVLEACRKSVDMPTDVSKLHFDDFNAFIKIANTGHVIIFAPNPECGQGTKTSMPMIIAEELDVAWEKVSVVQADLNLKNFDRQLAGGSQAIWHGWDALRETGATVRQMLVNAAALRWNLDPSRCRTEKGMVKNDIGDEIGYGDVASEAAMLPVPEKIQLKDPKSFHILGRPKVDVDIDKILTGKPLYGMDLKRDGMLAAVVIRPDGFGRKLSSFDASKAMAMPGIREIVVFGKKAIELGGRAGSLRARMLVGQSEKIAIVADNFWQASRARDKIIVEWQSGSDMESSEDVGRHLEEAMREGDFETLWDSGDIDSAFAEADRIVERTYQCPILPHSCLEPMNFFAEVTATQILLAGPAQNPGGAARLAAGLLERDLAEVKMDMTRIGGGFGRRLRLDFVLEAVEISDLVKKPIKVVYSREDDMGAGFYKPAERIKISAALKNNELVGYHLKQATLNETLDQPVAGFFPAGTIANYRFESTAYASHITTGPFRAPGSNFLAFAEEAFLDEFSEVMERDPVQVRFGLLNRIDDSNSGLRYSAQRYGQVIELALEKSDYYRSEDGVFKGFSSYFSHKTHVAQVAFVSLQGGGPVVTKIVCAVDCGIVVNPSGARKMVEGAILDGFGHAMFGNFSFDNGIPIEKNFDTYDILRIRQVPEVEVHFVKSNDHPTGLGEPALPPLAAAVSNAIYRATGKRLYRQPFLGNTQRGGKKVGLSNLGL